MRRVRPPVGKLRRRMARQGVGAGVIVSAATAGAVFVWLFRGGPVPGGTTGPLHIDLVVEWDRHVIIAGADGTGQPDGADGVDVRDIDGDGFPEVATGHEEGLRVTIAKHPGYDAVRAPWTFVTLGSSPNLCNPEDAVFGDLDADGNIDAIAACETGSVSLEAFFAPTPPTSIMTAGNWDREQLASSAVKSAMRIQIVDIAGDSKPEIVVGGKERSGPCRHSSVGYYQSATPRNGASWTHVEIEPAGWVMQLYAEDVNDDGRKDIVYSDRERIDCDFSDVTGIDNTKRGIRWLENLGGDPPSFEDHQISESEGDWKWFHLVDWENDGDLDIAACRSSPVTNESEIFINQGGFVLWASVPVAQPASVGQCQHATVYDLDQDGVRDIQFSYSNAPQLSGVVWQKNVGSHLVPSWSRGEISGVHAPADGPDVKFDNMAWVDLDGDGDLDVVTTEQHVPNGNGPGFGVIWYENPLAPLAP